MLSTIIKKHYNQDDDEKRPVNNNVILTNLIDNTVSSMSNNIFYNISIINPVLLNPPNPAISIPKIAKLSFTRDSTILNNPDQFRVAVSRLSFPSYLPLFMYPTSPSYYTITLSFVPTNPIEPVIQITKNLTFVASNIGFGDPYTQLGYNPVYYVQTLLNFVNQAYEEAYDEIVIAVNAIGENYEPVKAPYITYNPTTEVLNMVASYPYTNITKYGIFMNMPLFDDFFSGFYSRLVSSNIGGFNAYQIIIQDYGNNKIVIDGNDYIDQKEEFGSAKLFNKIDRVVVQSNMIPLNANQIGTSQQVSSNALLDFILPDILNDRRKIDYTPINYKWHELQQTHALRSIDIDMQIVYETGEIVPLFLNANSRLDMTLLFVPKGCMYQ